MASASISVRTTKKGARRYYVRYRLGGRYHPVEHGGAFPTMREARLRRDLIVGEIAAGRNPRLVIDALGARLERTPVMRDRFDEFIVSRVDVSDSTRALYRNARDRLGALAELQADEIEPSHLQAWIAACSDLSPATVKHYLSSVKQVLDFCDVVPNPAKSPKVRIPKDTDADAEVVPPDTREWRLIQDTISKRCSLIVRLIECLGLRVGEALALEFGDVDFAEGRLRVSRSRTKRRTAGQRWLPVPDELLDEIAALVPLEDRARSRRVFDGLSYSVVRDALETACRNAQIAHYSPHDLRHRRVSLWFAHGVDAITVKTWAGHSRASMSSDTYGHVVIDANGDESRDFWAAAYRRERLPKRARRADTVVTPEDE